MNLLKEEKDLLCEMLIGREKTYLSLINRYSDDEKYVKHAQNKLHIIKSIINKLNEKNKK